jgi:peptide/nickel transport system permease protein
VDGTTTGIRGALRSVVRSAGVLALLWRGALVAALVCGIGLLPWLSRTDPALTVLKARSVERDPTPEVLAAVRDELGLDDGPLRLLVRWLGGLLPYGDAARSWISGTEVMPSVVQALGVSLLLMAGALAVAGCTAGAVCARTLWLGSRRRLGGRGSGGSGTAVLAALPEFLTASVLASVVAVQLGWLPALGWYGPTWMVLPALSLGLPAGAILGRMLDDLLPGAFAEPWALAAAARGIPPRSVARHALRRCVPGLLPNLGLFVVGLTGGAVAIEQIFDIPGLGRLTLRAAVAQDLPVLQTGALALVVLAAAAGGLARLAARLLLGPALRDGALQSPHRPTPPAPRTLPLVYGVVLVGVVCLGLLRDPLAVDTAARLQAPTWAHPFGADALGRDVLARIGHGALTTLTVALAVSAAALGIGVLLGLLPRLSAPLVDTVNAVPPVLAGLLVTGVVGSGLWTPALAVAAVAWSPLATHTSALLRQERAATHLAATRALGAGSWYLLRRVLLPVVLPSVTRHALLRLPGIALALASLGFLGLGAQPPSPEWGLLLSENQPYVERAPCAVLAPAVVLALLGALAVTAAGGVRWPRPPRLAWPRPPRPGHMPGVLPRQSSCELRQPPPGPPSEAVGLPLIGRLCPGTHASSVVVSRPRSASTPSSALESHAPDPARFPTEGSPTASQVRQKAAVTTGGDPS